MRNTVLYNEVKAGDILETRAKKWRVISKGKDASGYNSITYADIDGVNEKTVPEWQFNRFRMVRVKDHG
ncbi:MAG: hypothetical protein GY923_15395 [Aestuariibacter sp.]|nr:hypothetical protein [Aestuariibacter sp.]